MWTFGGGGVGTVMSTHNFGQFAETWDGKKTALDIST